MTPILIGIAATAITSALWFLVVARIVDVSNRHYRALQATMFSQTQLIEHLRATTRPFEYMMRSDGLDTLIERGRPDVTPTPVPTTDQATGQTVDLVDIDDIPEWGDNDGRSI